MAKTAAAAAIDPLADLGLDGGAAASGEAANTNTENDMAKTTQTAAAEPVVGKIEIGFDAEVPSATRTGGGSQYPFTQLPAPAEGKIANFFVPYVSGDKKKFARSVQSATTQANRNKDGRYYESRSVTENGEFKGIKVFRTDNRPAGE